MLDISVAILVAFSCLVLYIGCIFATRNYIIADDFIIDDDASIASSILPESMTTPEENPPEEKLEVILTPFHTMLAIIMCIAVVFLSEELGYFAKLFFEGVYIALTVFSVVHIMHPWVQPHFEGCYEFTLAGRLWVIEKSAGISYLISAVFTITWLVLRLTGIFWMAQNVINGALVITVQELLRFPDLQMATYFMVIWFGYECILEIFSYEGYFLSSGFGESVSPLHFAFPSINTDTGFGRLSLFDVVIPGMFITWARMFDHTYDEFAVSFFWRNMFAFALGVTGLLLAAGKSQFGLVYIMPLLAIVTTITGKREGLFDLMWSDTGYTPVRATPTRASFNDEDSAA